MICIHSNKLFFSTNALHQANTVPYGEMLTNCLNGTTPGFEICLCNPSFEPFKKKKKNKNKKKKEKQKSPAIRAKKFDD